MSVKQTDIIIAGGGIAGLSLACILAKAGLDIALIEAVKPFDLRSAKPTGRTVALMQNSINILHAAGIEALIAPLSNPLKVMRILDDSVGGREPVVADFPASDLGMEAFGRNIPNAYLHAALWEAAGKLKNLKIFAPAVLKNYKTDTSGVTAMLENGQQIKGRLIVGADGRSSVVRTIAGIEINKKIYGQSAITCLISHARPHHDTATEYHRPGGPLALVPLPGRSSSVVWVNKEDRADDLMKLKKQEFQAALQDATNMALGRITLETNPECWPLQPLQATKLTAPRMALIAEAAHVMSPITAQGLNLSLRDVAAMAETIVDAVRIGLDPGSDSVLSHYESRRRTDIKMRTMGVDSMNSIVSQDIVWLKDLRRSGLKTIAMLPAIKRFAMRQGLAPDADEGRLARREAL